MKVLGFIPREMNWKEVMVRVYSEEIAAFYDPKTKTMHLIKEAPVAEKKKRGFLESLLGGKKDGFDKDENKTVIAHELTHALSDQNYDLDKMQKARRGGRRPVDGPLLADRRGGDPRHDRRPDGRLGRLQGRRDPVRRPRPDLQLDDALHVLGRR